LQLGPELYKSTHKTTTTQIQSDVNGTGNDHMVILHHFEQHFVTAACEKLHYFKWQSTSYCSHKSLCCEQHNSL